MSAYILDETSLSSEEFDGEVVAVNFATGRYYGMKGSAPIIWKMLSSPAAPDAIVAALRAAFESFGPDDEKAVLAFIDTLIAEKMLLAAASNSEVSVPDGMVTGAFEAPALEIHEDLQELILLDPIHDVDPGGGWPLRRDDQGS